MSHTQTAGNCCLGQMLAIDLKAAGIAPETDSGTVDFHALRGTYISHLVSSGASVKTCQVLARHSTASLTIGIYAKASLHDIKGAVEALPDLTGDRPRPEALAATGTEGNSHPTATQNATHPLAIMTQDVDRQTPYGIRAEDLKSSGRKRPCGFNSHRRYFAEIARERAGAQFDLDLQDQGRAQAAKSL